ncbi:unnamed protein product [Soboliphyme baturini]|uniref:Zf-RVT domain-containing protein n=1 Tax=Soboliphyme baturini TaxID=241478 RepID=A0A183IJ98_9BILA|nr:unnamed protein product [Soboliphyme baturini]
MARLSFKGRIEKKTLQMANHRQRLNAFDEAMLHAYIPDVDCRLNGGCDDYCDKFTKKLTGWAKSSEVVTSKRVKERIPEEKKIMVQKRRRLKTAWTDTVMYCSFCKLIRRMLKREDFETGSGKLEKWPKTAEASDNTGQS